MSLLLFVSAVILWQRSRKAFMPGVIDLFLWRMMLKVRVRFRVGVFTGTKLPRRKASRRASFDIQAIPRPDSTARLMPSVCPSSKRGTGMAPGSARSSVCRVFDSGSRTIQSCCINTFTLAVGFVARGWSGAQKTVSSSSIQCSTRMSGCWHCPSIKPKSN